MPNGLRWAILFTSLLYYCASAVAQDTWHKFPTPDGGFSFELPTAPEHVEQQKAAFGAEYTVHQYTATAGAMLFMVITAVFPDTVDVSDPRTNLQDAAAATATKSDTKYESVTWQNYQGLDALELTGIRNGRSPFRNVSLLNGHRYISLTYGGPPGSMTSVEANRFMSSLKVER